MLRLCSIFSLFVLSLSLSAQTGYKDVDTTKYTKSDIITNVNGFKTVVYYKGKVIRKILREFVGNSFSSTTIYYITDDQLTHNIYASMRTPNVYFEEHMYFANGKMTKWVNTTNKTVDSKLDAYADKEKLSLKFFDDDLKEAKTKKATH